MNRKLIWIRSAAGALILSGIVLHGCGSDSGTNPGPGTTPNGPASISVSPSSFMLLEGTTVQLTATVKNASGGVLSTPVTWTTSATNVATVSASGLVTALAPGTAEIRAQAGDVVRPVTGTVVRSLNLQSPLDGVMEQDFYLLNYVDQIGPGGIGDYNCGSKSYDGHTGVDITLRSFAQMDSLVAIIAAAPGRVDFTQDGLYDRNKSWENGGGFANHVVLEHGLGMRSYYAHMKKGSVAVEVGQTVAAGDTLGFVGSSGTSDIPHLHFELRGPSGVVDPFSGACATPISHWADQDPYRDQFALMDADLTRALMTLDLAKDRPPVSDTIPMDATGRLTLWVEYANAPAGGQTQFRVFSPDGSLVREATSTVPQTYGLSWWWNWWTLDGWLDTPGTWSVEYHFRNEHLTTRTFEVVAGSGQVAPALTPGPRSGQGGGGLESPHRSVRY